MLGHAWVELIKRIPAAHHDNLVAVTSTGAEIMVQRIMRLEEDFVVMRGRPAGSTEQGRVLILPWDQLNHVAFHKALPETEIQRIFGGAGEETPAPGAVSAVTPEATAPEEPTAEAVPGPAALPEPAPASSPATAAPAVKTAPVSKSVLLARLRARLAGDISKS